MLKLERYKRKEDEIRLLWSYEIERIQIGNSANETYIKIDYRDKSYCIIRPTEDEFFIIESNE